MNNLQDDGKLQVCFCKISHGKIFGSSYYFVFFLYIIYMNFLIYFINIKGKPRKVKCVKMENR